MRTFVHPSLLISILTISLTGCNTQPADDVTPAVELTDTQQKAINDIVAQIEAVGQAFAATVEGINDLESISLDSQSTCPAVSLAVDPDTGTTVDIDFPDGCTNEIYGESPVSGSVAMTLSVAAATLNVTFTNLTIDDQTTNGTLAASFVRENNATTLVGDINLTTTGVGSINGSMNVVVDVATSTIAIPLATAGVDPEDDDGISIAIVDMAIAPIANDSFIPQSGTVAFVVPNDGAGPATVTIVMTFDNQSPVDSTVDITIGTADPVEYTLPAGNL